MGALCAVSILFTPFFSSPGWSVISIKNDWKRNFVFETINEGGSDE
jgi:hypothetical protein